MMEISRGPLQSYISMSWTYLNEPMLTGSYEIAIRFVQLLDLNIVLDVLGRHGRRMEAGEFGKDRARKVAKSMEEKSVQHKARGKSGVESHV